jgi:23S rRNA (uracil1939-C5)-methyltransferase
MRYCECVRKGDKLTLHIDHLGDDGEGLGDVSGRAVHVPFALPGERADVEIAHVSPHRQDAWADLLAPTTGSPLRAATACAAFSRCGGCTLQHIEYTAQLALKTARVRKLLGDVVAPCVASPDVLGYRNKSKLVYGRARGELALGAYRPRSHELVDLRGCRVMEAPADESATRLIALLREAAIAPYDEQTHAGELRHVVLRSNARGEVLACFVVTQPVSPALREVATQLQRDARVIGVVSNLNDVPGDAIFGAHTEPLVGSFTIADELAGLRVQLSATAFFQVNRRVAELIYRRVVAAAELRETDEVIDCYSGIGIMTLLLARESKTVCGIEVHPAATHDAEAMRRAIGAANVRFVTGPVEVELAKLSRADVIVVNPPRKGVDDKSLAQLARLQPRTIVYVSCNPDSLARDLAALVGYRVASAEPFDMMPHTPHVETIAVLRALR